MDGFGLGVRPGYNFGFAPFPTGQVTDVTEIATDTPTFRKNTICTNVKDYTSLNIWTVRGLKTLGGGSSRIKSTPFTHQNSSKWCMVITKQANDVRLGILLEKHVPMKLLRAQITVREVLPSGEKREIFPRKWYELLEGGKTEERVIRMFNTAVVDNSDNEITLECEVTIQSFDDNELPASDTAAMQAGVLDAVDEMLQKQVLTDFELRAGDTVLKAHRAMLAVRSPYFATVLQPHTKEAQDGFVQISDVKPEVLKQVLLYMYTGAAPALKDTPWELLMAADKFQLQQLKRQCETHLANCLDADNAVETAANASLFSCDLLWDRAAFFIKHNFPQVARTSGWATAVVSHPEIVQRISEVIGGLGPN